MENILSLKKDGVENRLLSDPYYAVDQLTVLQGLGLTKNFSQDDGLTSGLRTRQKFAYVLLRTWLAWRYGALCET
jgi:hypothetical protein